MKKQRSKITKHYQTSHIICCILHFLCIFGPVLYYIPEAFKCASNTVEKSCLSLSLVIALVFTLMMVFCDLKYRAGIVKSIMWITILGITLCLPAIKTMIIAMAVISIIDEIFIVRLKDSTKAKLIANKEIDKRGIM